MEGGEEGWGLGTAGRRHRGRDVVVKTVRESWWEGQCGYAVSPRRLKQYRWCYRAAASPTLCTAPTGGVTLWNQSRSGICHSCSPWYFHFRCIAWHWDCTNATCRTLPLPSLIQPHHLLTMSHGLCVSLWLPLVFHSALSLLIGTSGSQWVTDCQAMALHPVPRCGRARPETSESIPSCHVNMLWLKPDKRNPCQYCEPAFIE